MNKSKSIANALIQSMNIQFQKNTIDDGFCIGRITNLEPFIVSLGDLPLYEDDLYIDKYLLPWREECTGLTTVANLHTHGIVYIDHPSKLNIGDYVVLYGIEWNPAGKSYQRYCLLNVLNIKDGV